MSEASDNSNVSVAESPQPREVAAGFAAARVVLKPRKAQPFFGRHPWVLDTAVAHVDGAAADGDVVDLISDKGRFIARGLYNGRSRLRVRLFTWDNGEALDGALFRRRLEAAAKLRHDLGYDDPRGACRLVFSEADALSGLVVDRYGEYLAVQATSLAIAQRLDEIVAILFDLVHPRGVVLREERGAVQMEGMAHEADRHWGELPSGPVFIEEHDLRYGVDLREGHKTGFYLDQRENRRVVADYVHGRRVLDMFCYSGGFSLNAVKHGGASEVLCVDTSEKALSLARANAELNGIANLHFARGTHFALCKN